MLELSLQEVVVVTVILVRAEEVEVVQVVETPQLAIREIMEL
jgi:hypothetical protein